MDVIISIVQMKKSRHKEHNWTVQDHTGGTQWRWDSYLIPDSWVITLMSVLRCSSQAMGVISRKHHNSPSKKKKKRVHKSPRPKNLKPQLSKNSILDSWHSDPNFLFRLTSRHLFCLQHTLGSNYTEHPAILLIIHCLFSSPWLLSMMMPCHLTAWKVKYLLICKM